MAGAARGDNIQALIHQTGASASNEATIDVNNTVIERVVAKLLPNHYQQY